MSKALPTMKSTLCRRDFLRCGALAAAFAASSNPLAPAQEGHLLRKDHRFGWAWRVTPSVTSIARS
jgi:hypothetical protein